MCELGDLLRSHTRAAAGRSYRHSIPTRLRMGVMVRARNEI